MKSWADLSLGKCEGYKDDYRTLSLYNTSSQKVEALPSKDHYRLYVCGITPYDATHLGHAATYVAFDLINRYLRFGGAHVSFVQNITDIDDPLFERSLSMPSLHCTVKIPHTKLMTICISEFA